MSRTLAFVTFCWTTPSCGANIVRVSYWAHPLSLDGGLLGGALRRPRSTPGGFEARGLPIPRDPGRWVWRSGIAQTLDPRLMQASETHTAVVPELPANNGLQPTHACRSPAARAPSQARAAEAGAVGLIIDDEDDGHGAESCHA